MSDKILVLAADDHRVGISLTLKQGTFKKLLKMSASPDMEGWSDAIATMIAKSGKP